MIGLSRLDRYIIGHIFSLTVIVALALTALYTFITFVSESGSLGKGDFGLRPFIIYVLWQIPTSLQVLLPIIALLGTLLGLGALAAQNEITAMRAAGVSLLRIGRATLVAGLVIGVFNLLVGDWLAPLGKRTADAVRAIFGAAGVGCGSLGEFTVPIGTPLPNISMHIVKTPSVCLLQTNGVSHSFGVGIIPAKINQRFFITAKAIRHLAARPARIFPFRLRWQTVNPPSFFFLR